MEEYQTFRLIGKKEIKIALDCARGQAVIYWEDVKDFFPDVEYVMNGDVAIRFMRDSNGIRIMPYCIKHFPGVVLDVVLSTAVEHVHVGSSMEAPSQVPTDSPTSSPSLTDAPATSLPTHSPSDAQTTTLPADSPTNQAGNFYMYLQPYSQGDVIPCVIDGRTICTQRGTVDKANACVIDDDLLKVCNSVRPWCSMHAAPAILGSEMQVLLGVGKHDPKSSFGGVKQVHIKSSGPEIKIEYDTPGDHWESAWATGRDTWKEVTICLHYDYSDWVMYVPEEYVTGDTMPVFKSLQRFDREPKPVREARANRLATQGDQGKQDSASICE
ncbi:hypothetical protein BGZ91_011643 [Linnemannia elongata]|nr:hypothetical protein BGZ91_011643 [Linnemannia elongata]KAG0064428.1 hypothetical protein BGZ90_002219 [Linnemannia elongata]